MSSYVTTFTTGTDAGPFPYKSTLMPAVRTTTPLGARRFLATPLARMVTTYVLH